MRALLASSSSTPSMKPLLNFLAISRLLILIFNLFRQLLKLSLKLARTLISLLLQINDLLLQVLLVILKLCHFLLEFLRRGVELAGFLVSLKVLLDIEHDLVV